MNLSSKRLFGLEGSMEGRKKHDACGAAERIRDQFVVDVDRDAFDRNLELVWTALLGGLRTARTS